MKVSNGLAYLFFLLCSLLLWAACFYAFNQTSNKLSYDLLKEKTTVAATLFDLETQSTIKKTKSDISTLMNQSQPLSAAVLALSEINGDKSYYVINSRGSVIVGDSTAIPPFSPSIIAKSRQQGYTHNLINLTEVPNMVATIFPYDSKHYIAQVEDQKSFTSWIANGLDLPQASLALLNKNGTSEIKHTSHNTYRITLPVTNSDNLTLSATVSEKALFPFAYQLLPFVMIAILIVFIALCVSFFIIRRRQYRPLPHQPGDRDLLTGLLNEASLETAISRFFKKDYPGGYNLVAMDVVAFRRFNVMFGQKAGNVLLNAIGQCLINYYYCGCRISGDVFVFMSRSTEKTHLISTLEYRLDQFLVEDLTKQARDQVSYNFGIYPLESNFVYREAYDGALLALKKAKSQPDENVVYCDRRMRQQTRFHRVIEANMFRALENDGFKLYVQPKFYAKDATCCGGEALVRWVSEEVGFLLPTSFIPLFEENGFISRLDFHIMAKVLDHMQRLVDSGISPLPISVNQSRITISSPNYLAHLKTLVSKYTIPLHLIEIEITESAVVEDRNMIVSLTHAYQEMGFTVAMDDFGTGYSSLNTLRELPVDVLKIDKDFLKEADTSVKGRRIIQGIVDMSRDIMIKTVCEGVETQTQYDFLRRFGCDIIQGYFLSKPIPYDEYEARYLYF